MQTTIMRDKTKKDTLSLNGMLDMFKMGKLRDDHPEQRHPSRWNNAIRDGFIATLIKEEDVDSIKVCEQVRDSYVDLWLIDGLQRLTNARMYREGAFKLGKNIELPYTVYQTAKKNEDGSFATGEDGRRVYETITYDLRGKSYNDLPEELKNRFDNYNIDMVKHLDCTDEEVGYHIRRYNAKVNMNGNEKAVTYLDKIAGKVKEIASHTFFRDCTAYKENDRVNGTIERSIMESLMLIFFGDNWKKAAKDQGMYLNENCTEEHFDKIIAMLDELEEALDDRHCKLFTSKNTLVFLNLFVAFKKLGMSNDKFDEFLTNFEEELCKVEIELPVAQKLSKTEVVSTCSFEKLDGAKSSKDKGYLVSKMHILTTLMYEYLGVDADEVIETENAEESEEDACLNFVRSVVNNEATKEDIELYMEVYDDLSLNVNNNSKLLSKENKKSLIAMVAYSFKNDVDLDDWFVDLFKRQKDFIKDQINNYFSMLEDFNKYTYKKGVVA